MSEYSNSLTSPDDILALLKLRVSGDTHHDEIATLMAPLALDSAWVYLGGSGARQQIYLLPNGVRVVFQFDVNDWLVAYGSYQTTDSWDKDQVGASISPVHGSAVTMILVSR